MVKIWSWSGFGHALQSSHEPSHFYRGFRGWHGYRIRTGRPQADHVARNRVRSKSRPGGMAIPTLRLASRFLSRIIRVIRGRKSGCNLVAASPMNRSRSPFPSCPPFNQDGSEARPPPKTSQSLRRTIQRLGGVSDGPAVLLHHDYFLTLLKEERITFVIYRHQIPHQFARTDDVAK